MQTFITVAVCPRDEAAALSCGRPLAHAAYRIDEFGRLLAADGIPDGGMMIVGAADIFRGDAARAAESVAAECLRRGFGSVLADLGHAGLADALCRALSRRGIGLAVREELAGRIPGADAFVSTAVAGGDFCGRMTDAARSFGAERVLLDIEPVRADFTLPSPDGAFAPLTREELAKLISGFGRRRFFSDELCCRYFSYIAAGACHIVLYDDAATLRCKLERAASVGICRAVADFRDGWELAADC